MCIIDLALYMEYEHTVVIEINIYFARFKSMNIYIYVCAYTYILNFQIKNIHIDQTRLFHCWSMKIARLIFRSLCCTLDIFIK